MTFAEFSQLPITADFSEGGSPLILTLSQGEVLTCTYVLATLADEESFQPSLNTPQPQTTNDKSQPIPSVHPAVLLHSTQNENGKIEEDIPDISTIPHPDQPDLKSSPSEEPDEIEGSPPAKKKTFLFRSCLAINYLLIRYKVLMISRRCFDSTWHPSKVPGHQQVLAPDSDEENMV